MTLISTSRIIFYFFLLFVLSFNLRCKAKYSCSDSASYDPGSQFETNLLNQLFPALSSSPQFFYNVTVGSKPDEVFGQALCRGDSFQLAGCRGCLRSAIEGIQKDCSNRRTATIWYNSCMLRYSDTNFFSVADTTTGICVPDSNSKIETNTAELNNSVTTLLSSLSSFAANSKELFKAGKVNSNIVLYGLAECTKDLSADDCYRCLVNNRNTLVTPDCNEGRRAAKIVADNCYLWYNDTTFYIREVDLVVIKSKNGMASETTDTTANVGGPSGKIGHKTRKIIILIFCVPIGAVLIGMFTYWIWKRITKVRPIRTGTYNSGDLEDAVTGTYTTDHELQDAVTGTHTTDHELQDAGSTGTYTTDEIEDATKKFSKRIGKGGFAEVFEATIEGRLVAVKRFFKDNQKIDEQKLEKQISLLANVEHPNILKFLGYCFGEYNFLVHEYMPNSSLNKYLRDPASRQNLNWLTRFSIIQGIAQGLWYLHNGLAKTIIHADLKLANILLDKDMIPKLADFDMLRAFETAQTHQSTYGVHGTLGYMPPEVALVPRKRYSVKSDVYSFGIMLLEIVTGEQIYPYGKADTHTHPDLITFVWDHWSRKTQKEVIDPCVDSQSSFEQIVRCIHVGLLCIQYIEERPDMRQVLGMLNSKDLLPEPSVPGSIYHTTQMREPGFPTPAVLESEQVTTDKSFI